MTYYVIYERNATRKVSSAKETIVECEKFIEGAKKIDERMNQQWKYIIVAAVEEQDIALNKVWEQQNPDNAA